MTTADKLVSWWQPLVATDTTHFIVRSATGGVYGQVQVVPHFTDIGAQHFLDFGDCEGPEVRGYISELQAAHQHLLSAPNRRKDCSEGSRRLVIPKMLWTALGRDSQHASIEIEEAPWLVSRSDLEPAGDRKPRLSTSSFS